MASETGPARLVSILNSKNFTPSATGYKYSSDNGGPRNFTAEMTSTATVLTGATSTATTLYQHMTTDEFQQERLRPLQSLLERLDCYSRLGKKPRRRRGLGNNLSGYFVESI